MKKRASLALSHPGRAGKAQQGATRDAKGNRHRPVSCRGEGEKKQVTRLCKHGTQFVWSKQDPRNASSCLHVSSLLMRAARANADVRM